MSTEPAGSERKSRSSKRDRRLQRRSGPPSQSPQLVRRFTGRGWSARWSAGGSVAVGRGPAVRRRAAWERPSALHGLRAGRGGGRPAWRRGRRDRTPCRIARGRQARSAGRSGRRPAPRPTRMAVHRTPLDRRPVGSSILRPRQELPAARLSRSVGIARIAPSAHPRRPGSRAARHRSWPDRLIGRARPESLV